MMAGTDSDALDPVLADIERAATEALASMRRTVGVLRDTDDAADLAGIAGLVDGFTSPIQKDRRPPVRGPGGGLPGGAGGPDQRTAARDGLGTACGAAVPVRVGGAGRPSRVTRAVFPG
ncbi:hypothetical protein ACI2L1_15890 [Streptomyces sp. NPDC019531]|uniref:hypothetical protein n=1 Tax=Streptomyces sp. NPDC019531 TaxID=3365062 RepID=UPI00384AC4AF